MPSCIQWGKERHQECTATADQGYSECTQTRDDGYADCCDWWPCSWTCRAWVWVSNIVCAAWTWFANVVCVAWTWITTTVCVLWDVVTTIINGVLVTIESLLGWVLSAVAFVIELFQMIPGLGALIRWILNLVTHAANLVVSLIDAGMGLLGIRPEKKLRVCTVILRDENGSPVATVAEAVTLLQLAVDMYKRDANVRIVPLRAFKYSTGFADAETVDDSWVITDERTSDDTLLNVPCNAGGRLAEWSTTGSGFQAKSSVLCFYGNWRRVVGYGAPVACFFIRDVVGDAIGCALWITDYATVQSGVLSPPPGSPRTLAHEVGHACNLTHVCVDDDRTNLMATQPECDPDSTTPPDRVNPRMSNGQVILVRMSKHVTYF